jgi:hypothetical protein
MGHIDLFGTPAVAISKDERAQLPRTTHRFVMQMLDTVLQQTG